MIGHLKAVASRKRLAASPDLALEGLDHIFRQIGAVEEIMQVLQEGRIPEHWRATPVSLNYLLPGRSVPTDVVFRITDISAPRFGDRAALEQRAGQFLHRIGDHRPRVCVMRSLGWIEIDPRQVSRPQFPSALTQALSCRFVCPVPSSFFLPL